MGLELSIQKTEETTTHCVYSFGPSGEPVGHVRLEKESGNIELVNVPDPDEAPNERYYLAHLVPRLHRYHDRNVYPNRDRWEV